MRKGDAMMPENPPDPNFHLGLILIHALHTEAESLLSAGSEGSD